MGPDRRTVTGLLAAAAAGLPGLAHGAARPAEAAGFDFLHGDWSVRHRKLRKRLARSQDWFEFPGTLSVRPILSGLGNVDDNVLEDPAGPYLATSLRLFNPTARTWTIWWVDGRSPAVETPVVGVFTGRKGAFYAEDTWEGRPIRVRFTYEDQGPGRAQWTQAFSADGGGTFEVNWIMDFTRSSGGPA
jgi:hypothetical protein